MKGEYGIVITFDKATLITAKHNELEQTKSWSLT